MDLEDKKQLLQEAIEERRIVKFDYHWRERIVEPYLVGIHREEQEEMLRAFQIRGDSESGGIPDWRLFRLERMEGLSTVDESFEPRRTQFEPEDPDMDEVLFSL